MASPASIIIAGGSGFIGASLARHLTAAGATVTILSRTATNPHPHARTLQWDARTLGPWSSALDNAAAIINLTGRTVDCVKTPDHKDEILRSRVESTRVLGEACRAVRNPPPVWVQMSTAHIYGDPPSARCDESSALGHGLAPDVGRAWEAAFEGAALPTQRKVVLRTSFVIGRPNTGGQGALGKLGLLARLGLGGKVGAGTQGMSWLHELDMNRLFERAINDANMHGVYIATAPNPLSQRDFMRALRRRAGGLGTLGIGLPAPAPLVRLGAPLVLRTDPELALYGRYLIPRRLLDEGFEFKFTDLDAALANIFGRGT